MLRKIFIALLMFASTLVYAGFNPRQSTVRVVVPYAPGGGPDTVYRIFEYYAAKHNIEMVPVHRPGADGQIGIAYAETVKPDGYNLMLTIAGDLSLRDYSKNFYPVSAICQTSMYIVTSVNSEVNNLSDLYAHMRADPKKLSWANSSKSIDRDINWIARKHNTSLGDLIFTRYNKGGPLAVAGGHVDIGIWPASIVESLVLSNKLKVLGKYQAIDPAPTGTQSIEQTLGKMDRLNGYGVFLPASTSTEVQEYWSRFVEQFKNDPEVQQMLRNKFFTMFPPGNKVLIGIIDYNREIAKND